MKIAVIGSTMMDIVSYIDEMPQAGETRRVNGFHIASGGKGGPTRPSPRPSSAQMS